MHAFSWSTVHITKAHGRCCQQPGRLTALVQSDLIGAQCSRPSRFCRGCIRSKRGGTRREPRPPTSSRPRHAPGAPDPKSVSETVSRGKLARTSRSDVTSRTSSARASATRSQSYALRPLAAASSRTAGLST